MFFWANALTEYHKCHMGQKKKTMKMMSRLEFIKVAISSHLLFLICVIGLLPSNPTVTRLTHEGKTITYPFYDRSTKTARIEPTEYYHRKLSLWIKDVGHKVIIIIFSLFMVIRPDFKQWGFDLSYMWIAFMCLMFLDHIFFRSRLNFGFSMEFLLINIQVVYMFYCWTLWRKNAIK